MQLACRSAWAAPQRPPAGLLNALQPRYLSPQSDIPSRSLGPERLLRRRFKAQAPERLHSSYTVWSPELREREERECRGQCSRPWARLPRAPALRRGRRSRRDNITQCTITLTGRISQVCEKSHRLGGQCSRFTRSGPVIRLRG
jgi:hypothetical protein